MTFVIYKFKPFIISSEKWSFGFYNILNMKRLLFATIILLTACQPEEITPNTPQPNNPTPNPTDTTGTDTIYTSYMLFEMFNNSTGQNLKNTVDSITFDNQATGFHKAWSNSISWHDVNNYGAPGNYTKCYIPTPTYGDQVQTIVYFSSGEQKNCWVTYNDLAGGSSVSIITSFGTNTYVHTRAY